MTYRWDETWHRLRVWTNGQGPSERLAAQILLAVGYTDLDPSHPLGGKDGGKDALAKKDGLRWLMAVYFPKGQKGFRSIRQKFLDDLRGLSTNNAEGFAFVTNQELTLHQRATLKKLAECTRVELYHLERITTILDQPAMTSVRRQFLGIGNDDETLQAMKDEVERAQERLIAFQTGGNTFCYWMLYDFDLSLNIARNFVIIRRGEFPLYDLRLRIRDIDEGRDVFRKTWGEMNSPADYLIVKWTLLPSAYYRVFFHARNGSSHQDLILKRSATASCWLAATRVMGRRGDDIVFSHTDNGFLDEFGEPVWRP